MKEKYIIYDLECFPNFFSAAFKDFATDRYKCFVIDNYRNDLIPLMKFLKAIKNLGYVMVGFNNLTYDSQLIEHLIDQYDFFKQWSSKDINESFYKKSQFIINLSQEDKFFNTIPEWRLKIPQVDIYKQRHYDGQGKRCSLKWLEFTMRFPNIESLPVKYDSILDKETCQQIIKYNGNDVDATLNIFKICKFETELRQKLSDEYGLNLLNASEPKLARDIFGKFLSDNMGVPYKELRERRTFRQKITVKDLLFDYIEFNDPLLKGAYNFFESLEFNPYNVKENNLGLSEVGRAFKYHNVKVDIGLGGIHACIKPGIYKASENHVIHDIDGKSYYPNLGIKNKLYPEHLSETFCDTYESLYELRTKIPKESPVNYVFKIILNSAYGLSKEMNNYFHDPYYTYSITINGQLLILKLAELFRENVPDIVFYQFNTDGITMGYDPKYSKQVQKCMKIWERATKIELEEKFYSKMAIRDVNNYLAVDTKGKVKRKGIFGYSLDPEDKEMEYHKNTSQLIVPKALEAYIVKGIPFQTFIKECEDIYDFCCGVKVKKDFNLVRSWFDKRSGSVKEEVIKQTVCRYYISKENSALRKKYKPGSKMEGRTVEVQAGVNTTYFNVYEKKSMEEYNIDYTYYIAEVRKILDVIEPNSTNLEFNF